MKIVILGANGQLGKILNQNLRDIYNLCVFTKEQLDITSKDDLKKLIELRPDITINCAAYTDVNNTEINNDLANRINNVALINISSICKEINSLLIHFSTDYVFDGFKIDDYIETDSSNPINEYGKSKLGGENQIIKSDCNYIIVRISWLFSQYGKNFFNLIFNKLENKELINVVDDQFGKPTFCEDVSFAIKKIIKKIDLKKKYQKIYHYSGGEKVSWFEFSKFIETKYNEKSNLNIESKVSPISFKDFNSKVSRPRNSSLNGKLILNEFDISSGNWKNGVIKLMQQLKK